MPMAIVRSTLPHNRHPHILEPHIRQAGGSGWIENYHWRGARKYGFWFSTRQHRYQVRWICRASRRKLSDMGYFVVFHTGGGEN